MADTQVSSESEGINPLIWVAVIVLVVIGGGYYFMSVNNKPAEPALIEETKNEEKTESATQSGTDSLTSGKTATKVAENIKTIEIEGGSFYFKPDKITVKAGDRVKILLKSVDKIHNLYIDEFNVKSSDAKSGEATIVEFTAGKKGSYEFYCAIGQHRQMGMVGTLIVQ
ncbi:cupredoxin domain-containing protein [Candidatus Gottesmanbacteria bacterium]|nr:cupredoxin domain-containing protein [Candidatus Gottesmanbacteria bacterium]